MMQGIRDSKIMRRQILKTNDYNDKEISKKHCRTYNDMLNSAQKSEAKFSDSIKD